jgi:hypothetical protein
MICCSKPAAAKDGEVADATTFRLDTADSAMASGWELESASRLDEFTKDGVTIEVQYSREDEIESLRRSRQGRADEVYGSDSPGKEERLRIWLGVRAVVAASLPRADRNYTFRYGQEPHGWTLEQFIAAVEDPADQTFLRRLLDLVEENSRQPRNGSHNHVWFGKRGTGAMFVYPFGRRLPPFKFAIRQGQLLIAGCWTGFPRVKNHPAFGGLAGMLDLDENGPASFVPLFGLDADELWQVGEKVSQAIN